MIYRRPNVKPKTWRKVQNICSELLQKMCSVLVNFWKRRAQFLSKHHLVKYHRILNDKFSDVLINFFKDKPKAPKGPLRFDEIEETSVGFSWQAPEDDGGKPIKNYIIQRREISKNIWTTAATLGADDTSVHLTKLREGQTYTFRVAAENEIGVGVFLESIEPITPQKKIGKRV